MSRRSRASNAVVVPARSRLHEVLSVGCGDAMTVSTFNEQFTITLKITCQPREKEGVVDAVVIDNAMIDRAMSMSNTPNEEMITIAPGQLIVVHNFQLHDKNRIERTLTFIRGKIQEEIRSYDLELDQVILNRNGGTTTFRGFYSNPGSKEFHPLPFKVGEKVATVKLTYRLATVTQSR